jgi:hypothetical protein
MRSDDPPRAEDYIVVRRDDWQRLTLIEEKAAGLVRTAHPTDVGEHEVVHQWWASLVDALAGQGRRP